MPRNKRIPMRKIVIDLDGTLTQLGFDDYETVPPRPDVVERLISYKKAGFQIVIHSARNMRRFSGNVGKINIHTLPTILNWLSKHGVPYDEVIVGKPWCGTEGFYVDDRAIRPSEFANLSYEEITAILSAEEEKSWRNLTRH